MIRSLFLTSLLLSASAEQLDNQLISYHEPIDAISIAVQTDELDGNVRGQRTDGTWTDWYGLEVEKEDDPLMQVSNLVIFPDEITTVEFANIHQEYKVQPIRVSKAPAKYEVAALVPRRRPRIYNRTQWGADESLLFNGGDVNRSDVTEFDTDAYSNRRVQDCENARRRFPEEFEVGKTVTHDRNGREYRWPKRYSNRVKLITVHHSAQKVSGDSRSGIEKVRAIYQYHANNRGWGDIGYNYLIDERGQIYEGRDGGDFVVGGHAFCANVGTVGVSLLGNFEVEVPSQAQMKALQWLVADLGAKYDINLNRDVFYKGKTLKPVLGHTDLVSTLCPGYYVRETLSQVRRNAASGNTNRSIRFPEGRESSITDIESLIKEEVNTLTSIGSPEITGRPGEQARIALLLNANKKTVPRRGRIAEVERSEKTIGVWQDIGGREQRVRKEIIAGNTIRKGTVTTVRLRIQMPRKEGLYKLKIGDVTYLLHTKGRPIGTRDRSELRRKIRAIIRNPSLAQPQPLKESIRIRLGHTGPSAVVAAPRGTVVGNTSADRFRIDLVKQGNDCVASEYGTELDRGVVRITPGGDGISTLRSWDISTNRFRGIIECQIVDGELVLINELPVETYLDGLAEEPDSEPYEKQRAFAIAARSYATHYMQAENRKFPGKPYDGDDSPARFQKYGGVRFEEVNPRWVEAVRSTSKQVIKKDGQIVKTPYFSSDDGRTKSPEEIGWRRFPFAEVFSSKPDPWCEGMIPRGHQVGMSGCGAKGQALEGKSGEEILMYYYPGTMIEAY